MDLELSGTVWNWYDDGQTKSGKITFTSDKKVKWNDGAPHGSWEVAGDDITAIFGEVKDQLDFHKLKYNKDTDEAILQIPAQVPPSKMDRKGKKEIFPPKTQDFFRRSSSMP